jgi:hypothetical protein
MSKKKKKMPAPTKPEPNPYAVALGRLGGQKTAERGSEYFRNLSGKRKMFSGGRPRKTLKDKEL